MDDVRDMKGLKRCDGARAAVHGRYRSISRPVRGGAANRPKDNAVVELDDGTAVFLELFDSAQSTRSEAERSGFEGKRVRVLGIVHEVMPAKGQSPLAPCVSQIERIEEAP